MTPTGLVQISAKLNNHQGQILASRVILASLVAANPNGKMDEAFMVHLILNWPLEGDPKAQEDIRLAAKSTMREILRRRVQ